MSTWVNFNAPDGRRMCALVECAPFQTPHVGARIVEVVALDPPVEAVVLQRELDEVLAERTALLEALIGMEVLFAPLSRDCTQHDAVDKARAAIAFATGEKK
jgi:hypothetical protein